MKRAVFHVKDLGKSTERERVMDDLYSENSAVLPKIQSYLNEDGLGIKTS